MAAQKLRKSRPRWLLYELSYQYVKFRGDCDDRRFHRYIDKHKKQRGLQRTLLCFGPRTASKGWHNHILYKCLSMIDPRVELFSQPTAEWQQQVQELQVALKKCLYMSYMRCAFCWNKSLDSVKM